MKELLHYLFEYKTLSRSEACRVLIQLAQGAYNPSQMAAFMTVFMMRPITVEELEGFRDAMLQLCIPVPVEDPRAIDLCGTGGDAKNTFNISTLAAFITAGAGIPVAKHGNYGVSSVSGSSNVLEYFGYRFTQDTDVLLHSLDQHHICFMHAPLFHPAMKTVAPIRRELGVKTFFNMLGPMVNPARPHCQLVGVFSLELARRYGYLYQQTDKQYTIVHALDGYDEVSLTGKWKMIRRNEEVILSPEELGLQRRTEQDLYGGDTVEASAKLFLQVLKGEGTAAQESVVLTNAAYAIQCVEEQNSFEDCYEKARVSLRSGRALKVFQAVVSGQ